MKKISIVTPCFNEHDNIQELYDRIKKSISNLNYDYEIIFVDNSSTDNSYKIYEQITSNDPKSKAIIMSRNFGSSQTSFLAGIKNATGDAIILIESDLQDPPELIPKLIEKWEEGFDVVYATRKKRRGSLIRRFFYKCFYVVFRWMSYLEIPLDSGDFSLIDKKIAEIIKKLPEKDIYIRGLRTWVGFKQTSIEYVRDDRIHGETSISFLDNFNWAKKAIVNFSYKPLEFISKLSLITAAITIIAAIVYVYFYFTKNMPKGFPTLLLAIFTLSTIQLIALGIIGEYLIRMFHEIKGRPSYIISEIIQNKSSGDN